MGKGKKTYDNVEDWQKAVRRDNVRGRLVVLFSHVAVIGGVLLAASLLYDGNPDESSPTQTQQQDTAAPRL